MPAGRPALPFDADLAEEICERLATSELGLEQIVADLTKERGESTPCLRTIYRWLESNEGFSQQSARARRFQAQLLHDRAQMQAQTPLIGEIRKSTPKGEEVTIADNVQRSQLIVQTTLKRAGQLDSKKYGDKVQQEISGKDGKPIEAAITVQFVKSNAGNEG